MATQIFVDSTAYLSPAQLEAHKIKVLSLIVNFEDESFLEETVDYRYFYQKLEASKALPTSSQPSVQTVIEAFDDALGAGKDIFCVVLSSEMSGTYQTAMMVASQLREVYPERRIHIVDSRSNCMQLGFVALTAANALARGASFEEAALACQKTIENSRFVFTVDTLKYLEKGGRIGRASAMIGALLNIKPILTVNDGRTDVMAKVRSRGKAVAYMVDHVVEVCGARGFKRACLHHIDNPEGIEALIAALPAHIAKDIEVVSIGPVIGTHVGPGAIGIVYETN